MENQNGKDERKKVVHVNRLHQRIQPAQSPESQESSHNSWSAPHVDHMVLLPIAPSPQTH